MKKYRQLINELPSKKIVFAFGRFQPPTIGHELLVNAVKKVAKNQGADHVIFASRTQDKKSNPLSVDRKVYYLKRMFPKTNFVPANEQIRTFMEAAKELSKKYKHLVMLAGSDRVQEYKKLLEKYNGSEFHFETIEVVSAGERDPDADSASGMSGTKMREAAKKGDFQLFKKGLPHTLTEIDGKRLMNEIRQGMGMETLREQVKFETNELREKYHAGEIFNVGDKVSDGESVYEVIDRGTNYVTVVNESGNTSKKWLDSVQPTYVEEDVQPGPAPEEISFKGYTTKNLHHSTDATKAFQSTIEKYNAGQIKDAVAILNALKATDAYMKINDMHLAQVKAPDETELASWKDAHDKARESLNRIGEFNHHMDYWHNHEHEIQDMENNFNLETQGAEFSDSVELEGRLIEMKFTASDKIKVARIIAATLGVEDVEKSSNPEQLVNTALRKVRSKPMRPEYIDVLHKMLKTASEADIKFDEKLVPQKVTKVEEATKPTALDKFRAASAERQKKHDEIEAKRKEAAAQGKENMSSAIDKLDKQLNKESDQAWAASKEKEKENALTTKDKSTLDKVRAMMAKEKKPVSEESNLEEGTFKYHMDKAVAAHDRGDTKRKQFHLDNAKQARYSLKSTEIGKHKDLLDKYKSMTEGLEEERGSADKHWDIAQGHKEKASLATKGTEKYHSHMADYHDSMHRYHSNIGQTSQADAHADKAEIHHEKAYDASRSVKESIEEAHKIGDTVKITRGSESGKTGKIGEIRTGAFKGAKKTYTIDHEGGSIQLKSSHFTVHKPTNEATEIDKKVEDLQKVSAGEPEEHQVAVANIGHTMTHAGENPATRKMKIKYVHEEAEENEEEEDEEEISDEDLDKMVDGVNSEDDILDAYDDEELALVDDETGEHIDDLKEEVINEVLSRIERIKAKARFARTASKRERRVKIALRTRSSSSTINTRARRLAIKMMKQRIARKPLDKLSIGEKERLEKIVQRRKVVINRLAMKLAPRVRKIESDRLSHSKYTKGN